MRDAVAPIGRRTLLAGAGAMLAAPRIAVSAPLQKLTLLVPSAPSVPAFAPLVLAQHLGFYAEAGYDVELVAAKGGVDVAKQVGVGNAEIGTAIGDTAIIVRSNAIPVRIVCLLGAGSLTTVVARPDRGIHKLADLRGKKISVLSFQDTTYFALLGALAAVGLGKADVDAQALGGTGTTAMVITGNVDGCACVPEREVDILNAIPNAVTFPTGDYMPTMAQALIASDETISRKPEMVRAMVRATLRGVQAIIDNPTVAAGHYVQAVSAFDGKEALIRQIMQRYIERAYTGQTRLGLTDPDRLRKLQDFYVKEGIVREATPVAQMYTNDFVP